MIKFLKFTKRSWVQNEHIPIEQHFILLLETNNALRAVAPTYFYSDHHLYDVFGNKQHFNDKLTVYECDLWSNVVFFWLAYLFIPGDMTKILGDMTSGEMTFGWHDRLPKFYPESCGDIFHACFRYRKAFWESFLNCFLRQLRWRKTMEQS